MKTSGSADAFQGRFDFLRFWCGIFLALFLVALGYIQIVQCNKYREEADRNKLKEVPLKPERGLILDRNGEILARSRPLYRLLLIEEATTHPWKSLNDAAVLLRLDFKELKERYIKEKKMNPKSDQVLIKDDITMETVERCEAHALELPAFNIGMELVRDYAYGPSLAHAIGYVGEIDERQLKLAGFQGCTKGEIVGKAGLELKYDGNLRGKPGLKYILVNSKGKELRDYSIARKDEPGFDMRTGINIELQKVLQEQFQDKAGAAIVLDPRNGEILALYSRPSYDPNSFAAWVSSDMWNKLSSDPEHPLYNQVVQSRNSPGSVFKVIITAAALQEGVVTPATSHTCSGGISLFRDHFSCWKEGGHGTVDLYNAFKKSCNVFFYQVGANLEIKRIAKYARKFGLGECTGVDLGQENPGLIPDPEWKRKVYNQPWYPAETVSVSIGQGYVGVTLIQLADIAAAVANEGVIYRPHLVREIVDQDGKVVYKAVPQVIRRIDLNPGVWKFLKKAMWGVVNDGGTGSKAKVDGFDVCGKTGTAQLVTEKKISAGGKANIPEANSWFIAFGPRDAPEIVAAIFVPHGGHGGEAAAPVAGAIFQRYLELQREKPGLPRRTGVLASISTGSGQTEGIR